MQKINETVLKINTIKIRIYIRKSLIKNKNKMIPNELNYQ